VPALLGLAYSAARSLRDLRDDDLALQRLDGEIALVVHVGGLVHELQSDGGPGAAALARRRRVPRPASGAGDRLLSQSA
jgi:hypothetical protein